MANGASSQWPPPPWLFNMTAQAVALLVMMPVFTFMGIKVSVLAGHLREEATR